MKAKDFGPDGARRKNALTCIDLFCGAGGLSEGFRQRGFVVVAANDHAESAATTFKNSHPDTLFINGPIEDVSARDILKATNMQRGQLDCLIGGPPCQAFSVGNHGRGMHDKRSGLYREYLRLVEGLRPKTLVMENVPGIKSVGNGEVVAEIFSRLHSLGYRVAFKTLKAEEYGVPQKRRRVFFVATRLPGISIVFPSPTHGDRDSYTGVRKPFVTVDEAICDLPPPRLRGVERAQDYPRAACSKYQKQLRKRSRKVFDHVAPRIAEINHKRMKHIPQGGSWRDIPHDLLPTGLKRARRCDHTTRYGRLRPDGLACTILTKCDPHWGAYIHPTQDRTLTVREAARLQSFPDSTHFSGTRCDQYRQVGNAVPPLLAAAIAGAVREMLEGKCSRQLSKRQTLSSGRRPANADKKSPRRSVEDLTNRSSFARTMTNPNDSKHCETAQSEVYE